MGTDNNATFNDGALSDVADVKAQAALRSDEHVVSMAEYAKLKDRDDKLSAIESKWIYLRHNKASDSEIVSEIRLIIEAS